MERQDETLICKECKKEFTYTVGEQEFYETKGFSKPVRCKECRDKRKTTKFQSKEETKK